MMKIEFIASIAVITADRPASRRLYVDLLGLPLEGSGDYIHSEEVGGCKSFGVWPLRRLRRRASATASGG